MLLNEKTLAVATSPIDPAQHLKIAKYMDVVERNFGAPERSARWCVYDSKALEKCRALSKAAFSRFDKYIYVIAKRDERKSVE